MRVGAKAAALALARQSGLPVLPGFVVDASASLRHMELGSLALTQRGSGGARLAVSSEPVRGAAAIEAAARDLSVVLTVRSSSPGETDGQWAGAFTSFLEVTPEELPKAVAGCWASVFSVDALERQPRAGIEPGTMPMAVLVQPWLELTVGGVAEISPGGTLRIEAMAGHPAPLLQGWERGAVATRAPGQLWEGIEAISRFGVELLDEVGAVLVTARELFGFDRCEWGVDAGTLWILQLGAIAHPEPTDAPARTSTPPELIPLVQALMIAPGTLGTELVLPWALAGPPSSGSTRPIADGDVLDQARRLSEDLTSQVWGLPAAEAMPRARSLLARLRGPIPAVDIATIHRLSLPEPDQASLLISTIHAIDELLFARGTIPRRGLAWHMSTAELRTALDGESVAAPRRIGMSVWGPLAAAVVIDHGAVHQGLAAADGIGAGLRHNADGAAMEGPPPRRVITAGPARPDLSQLLWDAAGLVTHLGSPAAHVFESARSLRVPAVSGVDLGSGRDQIIAVDGYSGIVATLPLESRP